MIERVENWDTWLVQFAEAALGQPFQWGRTDCATLVRGGLTAILGLDPWRGHVGSWRTRRGALIVCRRTDPIQALEASGAIEVAYRFAWSGDVALAEGVDQHDMFQVSLLLPTRKALTSTPAGGVIITDKLWLRPGTRFWRYGG